MCDNVQVPAVRAEACHTLTHLCRRGEEGGCEDVTSRVISSLRDRLVVEDDPVVTRQLVGALGDLGGSVVREDSMADTIASEVCRLGTSDAIIERVHEEDQLTLTNYIISRPLGHMTTRDYLTPDKRLI